MQFTGVLSNAATSLSQFTINLTSLTNGNVAGNAANFNANQSYSLLIASASGGIANFSASAFNINTNAFTNSFVGDLGNTPVWEQLVPDL